MNLSFKIAQRYIVSRKSHNAVNLISSIAVIGIIVATVATICVLSVFNGFSMIVENTFNAFDPDLRIMPSSGKVFKVDSTNLEKIKHLPEIAYINETLEENALIKYSDRQKIIYFKGVSPNFKNTADVDKIVIDGQFELGNNDITYGIIGGTIALELGVRPGFLSPLEIYIPKREAKVNLLNPSSSYNHANIFIAGVFSLNQAEYDEQMIIIPLELARNLLDYTTEVSSLDITVLQDTNINNLKDKIKNILGEQYIIQDRFEQHQEMYKMISIEKWITFLILFIIVSIAIFNIVGSLSMLILEKKENIKTLKYLGATNRLILQIFLFEGYLIVFVGICIGMVLGVLACVIQEHYGVIKLTSESHLLAFNAYPVVVEFTDVLIIVVTISIIGFLAVLYPLRNLKSSLKNKNLRDW